MDPMANIWQVALVLGGIICLVFLLGVVARRLQFGRQAAGKELAILESMMIGPKDRLVVVAFARQKVLIGIGQHGIARLGTAAAEDADLPFDQALEQATAAKEVSDVA